MSLKTVNTQTRQAPCNHRRRQGGFTAIELFVVIIVGLGIFIYAAANIDKLFGNSESLEEIRNVQQIAIATKGLRNPSTGYGSANTDLVPVLINSGAIPGTMAIVGTTIQNTWGGRVTVKSNGFTYTFGVAAVPKTQCTTMATKLGGSGIFERSVKIGGTATNTTSVAAVATACAAAGAAVELEFTSLN